MSLQEANSLSVDVLAESPPADVASKLDCVIAGARGVAKDSQVGWETVLVDWETTGDDPKKWEQGRIHDYGKGGAQDDVFNLITSVWRNY